MSPRSFITSFGAVTVALVLVYFAGFKMIIGAPLAAEHWLRGTTLVKLNLAKETVVPKVLFVGGSSTLFSIDTAWLSNATGRSVFNLGLHAGLPLKYHFDFAKKAAAPGDVIVVIPEYGYYTRDNKNTDWFINQVIAWDVDYYKRSSVGEKVKFLSEMPIKNVTNIVVADILKRQIIARNPGRAPIDEEQAMSVFRAGWSGVKAANNPERRVFQYYFNNLNDHGDMNNTVGADFPRSGGYGLVDKLVQRPEAWDTIAEFKQYCDNNGIKLVFGFAPVMEGDAVKAKTALVKNNMATISSAASIRGIPFIDSPQDVFFAPEYFFDTDSHLNIEGRKIRSQDLKEKIMHL